MTAPTCRRSPALLHGAIGGLLTGLLLLTAACDLSALELTNSTPVAPLALTATPMLLMSSPTRIAVLATQPVATAILRSPTPAATFEPPTAVPSPTTTDTSTALPATTAPEASATPTATAMVRPQNTPTTPGPILPSAGVPTATSAHRYVFPVQPAAGVQYGSTHHDYPATDIFCPVGSRFVAPTSGRVEFVSRVDTWDPAMDDPVVRGGLSVAVVGEDGVRYYGSHLSAVAAGVDPGVRVAAGQLLGYTGQSGNARYTDPHLHFGISRPTTPDDWQVRRGEVSPYPALEAWRAGRMITPRLAP